jgi:hypothetical protein
LSLNPKRYRFEERLKIAADLLSSSMNKGDGECHKVKIQILELLGLFLGYKGVNIFKHFWHMFIRDHRIIGSIDAG